MSEEKQKIIGYRTLSEKEVEAINIIKEAANKIGELVENVTAMEGIDQRWAAIAKTDLQKGFMELIRSIAQPGSF